MSRWALRFAAGLGALPVATAALGLDLPVLAMLADEQVAALSSTRIAVAPFDGTQVPGIDVEGAVSHQAWRHPAGRMTTLQILRPLRDQLVADGFEILFECEADICGGFDFRFATETLPEPAMHVDLGDFRFLSAQRPGREGTEYVCLMVSRSESRAFVQLTRVTPPGALPPDLIASSKTPDAAVLQPDGLPIVDRLERAGRAVLDDLEFASGSAALAAGEYGALDALAAFLLDNPARSVVLVGHTDADGALAGNIALSRQRAASVRNYLIGARGVPMAQVTAEGVGYLAPLVSNRTEDGRMRNRRVEVVLTTID